MLKHLLLSGWFRIQPFLNYVVVAILIAPLVAASGNSTSAEQPQEGAKNATDESELNSEISEISTVSTPRSETISLVSKAAVDTAQKGVSKQVSLVSKTAGSQDFLSKQPHSVPSETATKPQLLQDESDLELKDYPTVSETMSADDPLASVELAPPIHKADSMSTTVPRNQHDLAQQLRTARIKIRSVTRSDGPLVKEMLTAELLPTTKSVPLTQKSQVISTTSPAIVQQNEVEASEQDSQEDPLGSPYHIPWKWIQKTQEVIGSQGNSQVRYYRSVPVISPDGRYAAYSRVQLEVNPEMYNSRVSSVLFIEDRQTKTLQVMTTTAPVNDPLLNSQASSTKEDTQGSIKVLVPVSWSKKGDRFLARKFEGMMNTSDLTDQAVIWDREKNTFHCVTPSQVAHTHEMAILLGWSKTHPDHVLFRAGDMGDEEWSLMTVASDGSTAIASEADQPVTFGQKIPDLWADPPVAYR